MNNHHERIDRLRKMAQSGELSYADVCKRLTQAVEKEYQNETPNITFINACEDVLWELGACHQQPFASVNNQYLEVIHGQKLRNKHPHSYVTSRVFPIVGLCAFILLLSVASFHFGWLSNSTSPDNQQYVIEGHSITVDLIKSCIAEHTEDSTIQTDDLDSYISFLGFTPKTIDPSALTATSVQYFAATDVDMIYMYIKYADDNGDSTVLSMQCFDDIDEVYFAREQDQSQIKYNVSNRDVYVSSNDGKNTLTWIEESVIYSIAGTKELDVYKRIVKEIIGRKSNEIS